MTTASIYLVEKQNQFYNVFKFLAPGIPRSQYVSGPGEQLPGAQGLSPHCGVTFPWTSLALS